MRTSRRGAARAPLARAACVRAACVRTACALICAAALASGCAGPGTRIADSAAGAGLPERHEIGATPFFAQTDHHCGPAALATVLAHSGVDTAPESLARDVFIPGRAGALQVELLAAARRHGRVAYTLEPRLDAVWREIGSGRPVLVLQDLALFGEPRWHYAVVVGFDHARSLVTLRSGTTARLQLDMVRFRHSWRRAGHWAAVMLRPGELPAAIDRNRYLSAVADLEHSGGNAALEPAWQAALELWPDALTALVGLANALYARNDIAGARAVLEQAIERHPDAPAAHNNLAHVLGRLGERQRALAHARRAVELGGAELPTYRSTLAELTGS